jgi:hypothetical protein
MNGVVKHLPFAKTLVCSMLVPISMPAPSFDSVPLKEHFFLTRRPHKNILQFAWYFTAFLKNKPIRFLFTAILSPAAYAPASST